MEKRFERTLSQILSLIVLVVFISTIVSTNTNVFAVNYIWSVGFLIAWILMLVYGIYVLFQKDSYGLSVLTAIITSLSFTLLSIPAIVVLARFIPGLPVGLSFNNQFLNLNNQLVLYTALIVVYFAHLLNATRLKNKNNEYIEYDENSENSSLINNNFDKNDEDYDIITKTSDDKVVFETDNNQEVEYNTEQVELVEELTDEDLEFIEGEDNNG